MKLPRTIRILRLMTSVIFSILNNEPLLLKGNLSQLDELGGIYIKFLQIVVINLHSTNQENFLELLAVYEKSTPDKIDIHAYLRDLHVPAFQRLKDVEVLPFGTGSFGQVYRAYLDEDNKPIIIKVLRPSVLRYIRYDLRLLKFLSTFYGLIDRQKMLNFVDIYREFEKTCEQEINYVREAEVAEYFYKQYQGHPHMVIPKTYAELSNSKVIVQEYIDGLSVTDLYALHMQGSDGRTYVREYLDSDLYVQLYTIGYELLAKALTGKLIHADPHPGNIVLLPNNKVALIDFGMTTQLQSNRLAFLDLVKQYSAYYNHQNPAIEDLLVSALEFVSPRLYSAISSADGLFDTNDGVDLLTKLRMGALQATQDKSSKAMIDGLLQRNQIMKALFFAVNRGNRFGLTFDLQSIILLKSIHGYLSLVGPFDPDCITLANVLSDVVDFSNRNLNLIADLDPVELQPMEAIEILSNWFDKMARNDPWLMQKIAGGYIE